MSSQGNNCCRGCTRPEDADDMVACDNCSQWWHYSCAGVGASVGNRSWRCNSCNKPSLYGSVASSRTTRTTGTSARLRLQQLDESKALEDRLRHEQAENERQYLNTKHQLEAELEAEEKSEISNASSTSSNMRTRRREDVQKWVAQQNIEQMPDISRLNFETGEHTVAGAIAISSNINHPPPSVQFGIRDQTCQGEEFHKTSETNRAVVNTPDRFMQHATAGDMQKLQTKHARYVESRQTMNPGLRPCSDSFPEQNTVPKKQMNTFPETNKTFLCQQYPHNSGTNQHNVTDNTQYSYYPHLENKPATRWSGTHGLITPQQIAARQVVSRDLPKFSGDPLEWPMFLKAFESTTEMCGIQPDENLARLQKSLEGNAREKVLSILTLPEAIPDIIATLRDECGRPDQLVHCLLAKVRNAPTPNVNKLETLVTFGREVRNLVTYIEAAKLNDHLSNPMLLSELVGKLPPSLRLDWGIHLQCNHSATLKAFSDFVSVIKNAACQVSVASDTVSPNHMKQSGKKEKGGFVNAHSTDDEQNRELRSQPKNEPRPCIYCQRDGHKIRDCKTFKTCPLEERWKVVEENNLCQRCLSGHGKWPCRTKQCCEVDNCEEMHHKLLHPGKPENTRTAAVEDVSGIITTHSYKQSSTIFKILPVTLEAKGKSMTVFAFLDDGSELTLLESCIADELGLDGEDGTLCLQWTSEVTRNEESSRRVEFHISSNNSQVKYALSDVRTVKSLGLPKQSLNYKELSRRYPYLNGLPIESYAQANPKLLIGLDNVKLTIPLTRREGRKGEPIATKTRLGWTVCGGKIDKNGPNRIHVHACNPPLSRSLHDLVKDYFDIETIGTNTVVLPESPDDQRARKILEETTKRTKDGKFETGLLWKSDEVILPNSHPMALQRFKCLQRQLSKDTELKTKFDEQVAEFVANGYAHRVTKDEIQQFDRHRIWYLPLAIVRNHHKPGKIRIVWDAAARVGDTSLNSELLKGPDMLVSLLGVVFRFRQKMYAIAGDIRQMFLQLQMRPIDRQSQLFLYSRESMTEPGIYMLDVVTFGATCSPCSAQHVKNRNALEHSSEYPEAAQAIIQNTYVDDYLDSRDTIDELVKLATQVRNIHSDAGFEIRNWQSNAPEVLQYMGDRSEELVKTFTADKTAVTERVLGIAWNPSEDVLTFNVQFKDDLKPLISGEVIPTKRQVLRVVMSFFDPLGLISFYTIHGKIMIQDIWRSAVKWDDPINDADFLNWQRWIMRSRSLNELRIPRCYFPNRSIESYNDLQLHLFVDASEQAYCSVHSESNLY